MLFDRRAYFEAAPGGARFTIEYAPADASAVRGTVVFLHPFGEEMNKSRRMAAAMSRQLATDGWRVVQFDLHGCGDSEGDFADASWERWCEDALDVAQRAAASAPGRPWIWALRAGALLVSPVLKRLPAANVLLWQPAISGQQQLTQFLRIRAAQSALAGGARVEVRQLRELLAAGTPVEVGGYTLGPALASGLDAACLELPPGFRARVVWLEVSPTTPQSLSPASQSLCDQWAAAGHEVQSVAVCGPPFWQTQEIAECRALLEVTLRAMKAA